jgi:hypothetical protein
MQTDLRGKNNVVGRLVTFEGISMLSWVKVAALFGESVSSDGSSLLLVKAGTSVGRPLRVYLYLKYAG